jgi:hypothetical protein
MRWIGQHIWDFISRFRNDVYFENLAETAETRGLVVDADGKVSINPLSGDEHATHVYERVRNDEGSTIPVGTPVYSKGEIGGSERIKVGIADASDPTKMPAIGITNTELTTTGNTKDGLITLVGVYNTNLSGFSGVSENDIVYVAIGGGLTITKPTGTNLIQNVGIVLKTNGTIIQGLAVTCIGRTNDVPTPLYIDHANQRLGVGITNPSVDLHVDGDTIITGDLTVNGTITPNQDKHYTHDQSISSNQWTVTHNLNKYPSVQVIDSAGNFCIGQITHNSVNQLTLDFNSSFGGKAYLN